MGPSLLKYLFVKSDFELFEALSCVTMLLMGLGLINPANDAWAAGAAYKYVSLVFTQFQFGTFLIIFGSLGLLALKHGGLKCRLFITSLKTLIWMFIFSIFAIADPPRTISPFVLGYVIFNLILLGRQWSDYSLEKPTWKLK